MRRAGSPDRLSLAAGLVLIALGTVLLLDQLGTVDLDFAGLAPVAFGAVGVILLVSGLARSD